MKGIITFYIDIHPELNQDAEQIIATFVKINQSMIDKINAAGEYIIMYVPTTKEACRVDKIDFEKPFPRFPVSHVDSRTKEDKHKEGGK
jgi:hypothetical protein